MIPARRTCPLGWTREYEGYLMSSFVTGNKMSFECVDQNPDIIAGKKVDNNGHFLFKVGFSLFSKINQSACSTLDWVFNKQLDNDWVQYIYGWEFLIQ